MNFISAIQITGSFLIILKIIIEAISQKKVEHFIGNVVIGIIALLLINAIADPHGLGVKCHFKNSRIFTDDRYCFWHVQDFVTEYGTWHVGSHSEDERVAKAYEEAKIREEEARKVQEKAEAERQRCYNLGKDFKYYFDIISDYNLSCKKIAYINDHLLDNIVALNGGYIKGNFEEYRFFGSTHSDYEAHLTEYVVTGILATGQLMRNISYHVDCNNQTSNVVKEFYNEKEFVMYYVDRCIR